MFMNHEVAYMAKTDPVDFGNYVVLSTSGENKIIIRTIKTGPIRHLGDNFLVSPMTMNTQSNRGIKIEWYVWEKKSVCEA